MYYDGFQSDKARNESGFKWTPDEYLIEIRRRYDVNGNDELSADEAREWVFCFKEYWKLLDPTPLIDTPNPFAVLEGTCCADLKIQLAGYEAQIKSLNERYARTQQDRGMCCVNLKEQHATIIASYEMKLSTAHNRYMMLQNTNNQNSDQQEINYETLFKKNKILNEENKNYKVRVVHIMQYIMHIMQ